MKLNVRPIKFWWFFGAMVLFVGCKCNPVLPADIYEPNDTKSQAVLLQDTIQATIAENNPPDFFKFDGIKNESVQLDLKVVEGGFLRLEFKITDANDTIIQDGFLNTNDNQAPKSWKFVLPETQTYHIRFEGFYVGPGDSICAFGQARYQVSVQR